MKYTILLGKRAAKQFEIVKRTFYIHKVRELIDIIENNPFQTPPPYEKLTGNLSGAYSRRINEQHRLVYEIDEKIHAIRIISMWSHYE